jgi:hypothetical protein
MADTVYEQSMLNKSREDKFLLVINLPQALREINKRNQRNNININVDTLQFSIYGTVVPRIQVPPVEARYMGSTVHLTSHSRPAYAPISVNFTIDNMFNNYWVIFSWLNLLRDQKEGTYGIVDSKNLLDKTFNIDDYSTTFTVYGKDEFNKNVIQWNYIKAFPVTLGEINYNYRNGKEIETSFEFAFHEVNLLLI